MQRNRVLFPLCLLLAAVHVFLFHDSGIGLNLLLFELAAAGVLWFIRPTALPQTARWTLGGTMLSALMVAWHGSLLAVVLNLVSAALTVGILLAPELRALHQSALLAAAHLPAVPGALLRAIPARGLADRASITPRHVLSLAAVPLFLVLFGSMYRASNPFFDGFTEKALAAFDVDMALVGSIVLGLLVSGFILLPSHHERLMRWAAGTGDQLQPNGEATGPDVRREIFIAMLLLGGLNVLLLIVNALDIRHVWTGFQFDGQYLKQFVREGTYMLMLSIVLGAAIVLYFFRGDLNFACGARPVRWLAYAWLGQNIVLALSVGMRNFWYIHYYALAYKRIGVGFFLLALCIVLALVVIKVQRGRSAHFLLRTGSVAVYAVALVMALFNWDGIMARYNLAQQGKAFVHLDFLATLSDKALPRLVRSQEDLALIDSYNASLIGGEEHYSRDLYMTPEAFRMHIDQRVQDFLAEYPKRSWKEWNRADEQAYRALQDAPGD